MKLELIKITNAKGVERFEIVTSDGPDNVSIEARADTIEKAQIKFNKIKQQLSNPKREVVQFEDFEEDK